MIEKVKNIRQISKKTSIINHQSSIIHYLCAQNERPRRLKCSQMLFNSLPFLLFFPVVCVVYYCIPGSWLRLRNLFLLAASYYFYMNWEPAYALLLLTSTVVTYASALGIAGCTVHSTSSARDRRKRKAWLVASLVLNLSLLVAFKYYNFLSSILVALMDCCGVSMEIPVSKLLLPVGISFYTFQALGYTIDVYRGTTSVERDVWTYALFVSFFPQLVAGPIERSNNLLPQFKQVHRPGYDDGMTGLRMMVWGYFLKLVVADRCGDYVNAVFNHLDMHNGGSYAVAALLFPFQIYGDFAGYSLIAIGAARILGFRLMENFRRPYLSCSVGEFWHRWHVSLSTWFKDYVYIPLGGNRVSRPRQYWNLMVTFVVSGLWHGANWTFLCWGALHGMLLCIEKAVKLPTLMQRAWWLGGQVSRLGRWLLTFVLVSLAWVFFRADTLADVCTIFKGIATRPGVPFIRVSAFMIIGVSLVVLLVDGLRRERQRPLRVTGPVRTVLLHVGLALMIAVITLFGVLDSSQFIYFQF